MQTDSATEKRRHRNPLSFLLKPRQHLFPNGYNSIPSKKVNGVFGAPLKHATKCGSVTAHGLCVPEIVSRCFTEIMKRGLHVEGLFRLSGAASEVEVLQREFDRPPTYGRYLDLAHHDIHAITGVVKKYLRNLPDPVIPTAYHSRFLKMDEADEISTLASLIQEFPVAHYQLTHYIIILISYIQQYSHINLMTAEALAIILTPVCTGLEQTLKDIPNSFVRSTRPHMRDMRHFVETNAKWTHVWHIIIENHRQLLEVWNTLKPSETWQDPLMHSYEAKTLPPFMTSFSVSPHSQLSMDATVASSAAPVTDSTPYNAYSSLLRLKSTDKHPDLQHRVLQVAPRQNIENKDPYWSFGNPSASLSSKSSPMPSSPPPPVQQERYGVVVMRRNNKGYKGGGRQKLKQSTAFDSDSPEGSLDTLIMDLSIESEESDGGNASLLAPHSTVHYSNALPRRPHSAISVKGSFV